MAITNPPRITLEELGAAISSIYYNPYLVSDGRQNYSPEGQISLLRGAMLPYTGFAMTRYDARILNKAMEDLADFLNFTNVNDYCDALLTEGNKIWKRITDSAIPAPTIKAAHIYPFPLITGESILKDELDQRGTT